MRQLVDIDRERWEREVSALRRGLRRAVAAAEKADRPSLWRQVGHLATEAEHYFAKEGWPDWWTEVQTAQDDALLQIRRLEDTWR